MAAKTSCMQRKIMNKYLKAKQLVGPLIIIFTIGFAGQISGSEYQGATFHISAKQISPLQAVWDWRKFEEKDVSFSLPDYHKSNPQYQNITDFGHGQTHLVFPPSNKPISQQNKLALEAERLLGSLREAIAKLEPSEVELRQKIAEPSAQEINRLKEKLKNLKEFDELNAVLQKLAFAFTIDTKSEQEWVVLIRDLMTQGISAASCATSHFEYDILAKQKTVEKELQLRDFSHTQLTTLRMQMNVCNESETAQIQQAAQKYTGVLEERKIAYEQCQKLREELKMLHEQKAGNEKKNIIHRQKLLNERLDFLCDQFQDQELLLYSRFIKVGAKLEALRAQLDIPLS